MAQMIRKQIYLEKRQQSLLKRLAKARKISEAEVIRRAIEREAVLGVALSPSLDPTALTEIIRFALNRRQLDVTGEPYQWKRDDAYEERLSRFDRYSSQ
jgi:hypothetical protein